VFLTDGSHPPLQDLKRWSGSPATSRRPSLFSVGNRLLAIVTEGLVTARRAAGRPLRWPGSQAGSSQSPNPTPFSAISFGLSLTCGS